MKILLFIWPLATTLLLFLLLILRMLVTYPFVFGDWRIHEVDIEAVINVIMIPAGHVVAFSLPGWIVLKTLREQAPITKVLIVMTSIAAALAVALQFFWRYVGNGISAIDCGSRCAHTFYVSEGLTFTNLITWIVLAGAFAYFSGRAAALYKKNSSPAASK